MVSLYKSFVVNDECFKSDKMVVGCTALFVESTLRKGQGCVFLDTRPANH